MNPVHVLMHVRENIFYFYLENRILGPPKVDHVTFTTSLNILPIEITLLQLLCFFAVKESSRVLTEPFASLRAVPGGVQDERRRRASNSHRPPIPIVHYPIS